MPLFQHNHNYNIQNNFHYKFLGKLNYIHPYKYYHNSFRK